MAFKGDYFIFEDNIYSITDGIDISKFIALARTKLLSLDGDNKIILSNKIKTIYDNYYNKISNEVKKVMIEYFPFLLESIKSNNFESDGEIYELDTIQDEFKDNYGNFEFVRIVKPFREDHNKFKSITQKTFNDRVYSRYQFLKELELENVIIAGGFCRSILLDDDVKDFDIFFTGEDYIFDLVRTLKSIIFVIKKYYPKYQFLYCFKKTFNILELIVFDNFDTDKIELKFQFIMTKYESITDVLESFDLNPCKVAWDGNTTYFTKSSMNCYKYMINFIDLSVNTFKPYRVAKYLNYGFDIGMSLEDFNKIFNKLNDYHYEIKFGNIKIKAYSDFTNNTYICSVKKYSDKIPDTIIEGAEEGINSYIKSKEIYENKIKKYGGTYITTYISNNTLSLSSTIKFYEKHGGTYGINKFIPYIHFDNDILYCKFSSDYENENDIVIIQFNEKTSQNTLYYGYDDINETLDYNISDDKISSDEYYDKI